MHIHSTEYLLPGQRSLYHGKVRDVYEVGNDLLVMVATDRISAFDVVLPKTIPFKGQVLNQIAGYMLDRTSDILPNWKISSPDPNVTIGHRCQPFKVEMVIRGYLSGHAWRTYSSGRRELCGVTLPPGLKEHDRLPFPIITPTTKATEGHDEDVSKGEIIARGIVSESDYKLLEQYTYKLFERGTNLALERGLLLVDTKYEFGQHNEKIMLMDEIHTPDSSRYFYARGYQERQDRNDHQRQLSKEFVREWLIAHNFNGKENQVIPEMSDEFVQSISDRYMELYEQITGLSFKKQDYSDAEKRIEANIKRALSVLT